MSFEVANFVRTEGVAGNWRWWAFTLTGVSTVFFYARMWRRSGVLTDLDSYASWNPMIRSASGALVEGSRLDLRFEPEGRKARRFRPRLLVISPARELRWLGNPGVPVFFESEHYFLITPTGDGACRLEHNMLFYGLAASLMNLNNFLPIFSVFNHSLVN